MQLKDQFKEHWRLGAGWKLTVAATTVAAVGGVALASPGAGSSDLPGIDLQNPTVIEVDDSFQVVPGITVLYDDDTPADSPFLASADDTDDGDDGTSTTIDDDTDDSDDVTSITLTDDDTDDDSPDDTDD